MHHLQIRTALRPQKMSNLIKDAMSGGTDSKLALRDANRESKRRIVQNALQTEDMDQERLLEKVQDRLHRCAGNASLQVVSQALVIHRSAVSCPWSPAVTQRDLCLNRIHPVFAQRLHKGFVAC